MHMIADVQSSLYDATRGRAPERAGLSPEGGSMQSANGVSGTSLLIGAALLGVVVSVVNYVTPDNGIAGTPGALLVIVSTAALALVGFALRRRYMVARRGGVLWPAIALFLLAGTALAGWLLETAVLVALMMLAALSWLYIVIGRRRDA
jgi:hypothetical protein